MDPRLGSLDSGLTRCSTSEVFLIFSLDLKRFPWRSLILITTANWWSPRWTTSFTMFSHHTDQRFTVSERDHSDECASTDHFEIFKGKNLGFTMWRTVFSILTLSIRCQWWESFSRWDDDDLEQRTSNRCFAKVFFDLFWDHRSIQLSNVDESEWDELDPTDLFVRESRHSVLDACLSVGPLDVASLEPRTQGLTFERSEDEPSSKRISFSRKIVSSFRFTRWFCCRVRSRSIKSK